MTRSLVVDFDGVVCDAFEECALVTWLGLHGVDPDLRISSYLRALPTTFLDQFAHVRNFARTLDEFVVAHVLGDERPRTLVRFREIFDELPGEFVRTFLAKANHARQRCRREEPKFWLNLHALYPGIDELLSRHAGEVYVITAKDAPSVWAILRDHRLEHTVKAVYGEASRKDDVMRQLCREHDRELEDATFIDDNLLNVSRVSTTGARAQWAFWGYHTPEDVEQARAANVQALTLDALPALAA